MPAQRRKRVFGIDIETCRVCGGAVRIMPKTLAALAGQALAGIEDPVVNSGDSNLLDPERTPATGTDVAFDHLAGIVLDNEMRAVRAFPGTIGMILVFCLFLARPGALLSTDASAIVLIVLGGRIRFACIFPGTVLVIPVAPGEKHGHG